jgi:hypothetical protein
MESLPHLSYRSALEWRPEDGTILPDDTIITVRLGEQVLELRHRGDHLAVQAIASRMRYAMVIQPRFSNEVWIRFITTDA